jgi:single-stranded DNA-binding protein
LAEKAQKMLTKGQEIILEVRLVHQSYETKTGEKRNETSIEITEFLLLAPRNGSEQKSENAVGSAGKSN